MFATIHLLLLLLFSVPPVLGLTRCRALSTCCAICSSFWGISGAQGVHSSSSVSLGETDVQTAQPQVPISETERVVLSTGQGGS